MVTARVADADSRNSQERILGVVFAGLCPMGEEAPFNASSYSGVK